MRAGIEASLAALGVRFDVWTSEARLHEEGWVERAVERLRAHGSVYEQDGAVWFRSTDFGDDKDRVILRSNGEPTYFAADIDAGDRSGLTIEERVELVGPRSRVRVLETELIERSSWRTRADARLTVFDYIEAFYNPRRRHKGLGQLSPAEFERRYRYEERIT